MGEGRLRTALAVSVALNLFAIGAIGSGAFMWLTLKHPPVAARGRPLRNAADGLPPAERAHYLAAFRAANAAARPIQISARESRRLAASLFIQPTFDAAAVTAALAKARDADFALRARLEATMVNFAQGLPAQDRATLARGLARGGPLRQPMGGSAAARANQTGEH